MSPPLRGPGAAPPPRWRGREPAATMARARDRHHDGRVLTHTTHVLPAIPSTWRSPITPCRGAVEKVRRCQGDGPSARCDSPEGGRRDGRQDRSLPNHNLANRVAIPEICPSGEEPPEAKKLARALPSPHPEPGGVPPCQLTGTPPTDPAKSILVVDNSVRCGQLRRHPGLCSLSRWVVEGLTSSRFDRTFAQNERKIYRDVAPNGVLRDPRPLGHPSL